jgi:glucokinase
VIALAGDVGGTKIHLAVCEVSGAAARPRKLAERRWATPQVPSFPAVLRDFAHESNVVPLACVLGVAGWVRGDRVHGVNLPWELDARELSRALNGIPVRLVNDLEAAGHGIGLLGAEDLVALQPGQGEPNGNRALVSPGTGLGECLLYWDGERHRPVPSEGAHADFAPTDEQGIELLRFLLRRRGRASWEDVVSGPGLVNVYVWLRDTGIIEDDCGLAAELGDSAPSAEISSRALSGDSAICRRALSFWARAFGAEAGNIALRGLTTGGVYLGGGIPAQVLPELERGGFASAFRAKAAHGELLGRIPIHVVTNVETSLLGAAAAAARLAAGKPL